MPRHDWRQVTSADAPLAVRMARSLESSWPGHLLADGRRCGPLSSRASPLGDPVRTAGHRQDDAGGIVAQTSDAAFEESRR